MDPTEFLRTLAAVMLLVLLVATSYCGGGMVVTVDGQKHLVTIGGPR